MEEKTPILNLEQAMGKIVASKTAMLDGSLTQYIKSCISLLEAQRKDITEYALISVENPFEMADSGIKITYQWRIVKIDSIKPALVMGEE